MLTIVSSLGHNSFQKKCLIDKQLVATRIRFMSQTWHCLTFHIIINDWLYSLWFWEASHDSCLVVKWRFNFSSALSRWESMLGWCLGRMSSSSSWGGSPPPLGWAPSTPSRRWLSIFRIKSELLSWIKFDFLVQRPTLDETNIQSTIYWTIYIYIILFNMLICVYYFIEHNNIKLLY